jgi:hypothetical protein
MFASAHFAKLGRHRPGLPGHVPALVHRSSYLYMGKVRSITGPELEVSQ